MNPSKKSPELPRLTLRDWWHEVGTAKVLEVVAEVGTSLPYMRLLSYRLKRPSYDMAQKIIAAARLHTKPFEPDLELMMAPLERRPNPHYSRTIQPSAAFREARR